MAELVMAAVCLLRNAGYHVEPADGIPGLWNVAGLASDVTGAQLCDLAKRHGTFLVAPNIHVMRNTGA